jgi:hypothetical protein
MNSTRIRYLAEPAMSDVDRNLTITNEVRTIMTTAALPTHDARQHGLELLVSRVAVAMLHWSSRRARAARLSHERMDLLRSTERAIARVVDAGAMR